LTGRAAEDIITEEKLFGVEPNLLHMKCENSSERTHQRPRKSGMGGDRCELHKEGKGWETGK